MYASQRSRGRIRLTDFFVALVRVPSAGEEEERVLESQEDLQASRDMLGHAAQVLSNDPRAPEGMVLVLVSACELDVR